MSDFYQHEGTTYEVDSNMLDKFLADKPGATKIDFQDTPPTFRKNKSEQEIISEKAQREANRDLYALEMGVPRFLVPYHSGITAFTNRFAGGLIELVDNYGYKPTMAVVKSLNSDKSISESFQEVLDEGYDIDTKFFEEFSEKNALLQSRFYDEDGKELDVLSLLEKNRIPDAIELASQQATESAPSLALSLGLPVVGSLLLGASVAGNETKENLDKRRDEGLANIYFNGFTKGANEFLTELVGGKLGRMSMGLLNKGTATPIVKEVFKKSWGKILSKAGLGYLSEGATEGTTEFLNLAADAYFFGDEITGTQYLRKSLNAGIIGGLLGGVATGGGYATTKTQRQQIYGMLTPEKDQMELMQIDLKIKQNEKEIETNPALSKYFNEKIRKLQEQDLKIRKKNFDAFENMSEQELIEYAKNFDRATDMSGIIYNKKSSKAAKEQAEIDLKQALADMDGLINNSFDAKFEEQVLRAKRSIERGAPLRKGAMKLLAAMKNKGAKIKHKFGTTKEFEDYLRDKQLDEESEIRGLIQGMEEVIADDKATREERQEAIEMKEGFEAYLKNKLNVIQGQASRYGGATLNKDGSVDIFINDEAEIRDGVFTTDAHEIGHAIIFLLSKANTELAAKLGVELKKEIDKKAEDIEGTEFQRRYKSYTKEEGQEFEIFSLAAESIEKGDLKFNEGFATRLNDAFRRFFKGVLGKSYEFNTGKDVFNFLKDYNKSIESGIVNKGIVKAVTQGVSGKLTEGFADARSIAIDTKEEKESTQVFSKEASDKVQDIYEKQGEAGLIDILEQFKPITTRIARRFKEVPGYDEQLIINEIETGKRGILDIVRDYPKYIKEQKKNNKKVAPLAGFINNVLPNRSIEAANRILKTEFELDITEARGVAAQETAEDAVTTTERKTKGVVIGKVLGMSKKANEIIKPEYEKHIDSITNLSDTPMLLTELVSKISGIPVKKLKTQANLNQHLAPAQMAAAKNAQLLLQMLPKQHTTKRVKVGQNKDGSPIYETRPDKSTKVPKKVLDFFYNKGVRKDNLTPYTKKRNLSEKDIVEFAGVVDGTRSKDENRYYQQNLLGLFRLFDRVFTNQELRIEGEKRNENIKSLVTLREGMSEVMFSKDDKKISNDYKQGDTYFNFGESKESAIKYVDEVVPRLIKVFEEYPGLLSANELLNGNKSYLKLPKEFRNEIVERLNKNHPELGKGNFPKRELGKWISGAFKKGSRLNKGVLTVEKIQKAGEARINLFNKQAEINFDAHWKAINKALSKDPTLLGPILMYLGNAINSRTHVHRAGAKFIAFDNTIKGKVYLEHALQNVAAYRTLVKSIMDGNFNEAFKNLKKNYKLIGVSVADNKKLDAGSYIDENGNKVSFKNGMGLNWNIYDNNWWERYFNKIISKLGGINPENFTVVGKKTTLAQEFNINSEGNTLFSKASGNKPDISKAILDARAKNKNTKSRGASVFDFDETLIIEGENFIIAKKGYDIQKISSGDWPILGSQLADEGYSFDFTDFVNVRGGVEGPLLQKMRNQIKKYGPNNVFVLTARPQEADVAIHEWLKTKNINIPFKNITGLANSTGDAKAAWILNKYTEGYNDMYFVDDALPNVEAVQHVFDQLDIKGKSVQAKIQFSKELSPSFNQMLERTKGIGAEKIFSRIGAQKRGKNIGRFAFFVPPSADDFVGLLRYFVGKGEQGNADIAFFKKALIDPFSRADEEMKRMRQTITDDYKALRKKFPKIKKKLGKMIGVTGFTFDNAIRVYLWDKAGFDIPGLSKRDIKLMVDTVNEDANLKAFADTVGLISKQSEGYVQPGEYWNVESIASDLMNVVNKVSRKQFLAEWIENKNEIFSENNLNKIEATYGSRFREALENILWRMENGTNRPKGMGRLERAWTNWVNNSVGTIMFFNMRSAVLQTLSTVNFINFQDNNVFAAAKAFANQKQYWKDFSFLFNSDFLKQRRAGLQLNVNEAELASAVAGATNKAKAAIAYLLKIGFTPTQIVDSFAIAAGGSTYYRNRIKKYIKEGMNKADAEKQAMLDFTEIAEETQQSARPDRISQQQASGLGRLILAFANTPMQYNRLIKKAAGDLINRRGDWRSNVSRIIYYGAVQSFIFSALQQALFGLAFDDEEDDEQLSQKAGRTLNSMLDSLLRGSGLAGAVVSAIKNGILELREQNEKGFRADYGDVLVELLNVSPPIGSKARKVYKGGFQTYKFNREVMGEMNTFDLDNPVWDITGNVVSAATNLPLDRGFRKIDNISAALNQDNETWQRIAVALGWDQWSLGIETKYEKRDKLKKEIREKKKEEKKKAQQRCTKIKSDGSRCKIMVNKPKTRCHYHD